MQFFFQTFKKLYTICTIQKNGNCILLPNYSGVFFCIKAENLHILTTNQLHCKREAFILEIFRVICTTLLSVIVLFFMAKILGGKQISQLSLFDYINGITIGSIGAELATSEWTDTLDPLIAIVLYTIAAFLINFISDHCIILRRFLEGRSIILVKGGTFNRSAFHRAKLNLNEFMVQCRASGYYNMQDIDTAILESNGQLSILPKATARPLTPQDVGLSPKQDRIMGVAISDGKILAGNLKACGLDEIWLQKKLTEQHLKASEVFLAVCDCEGAFYAFPTEQKSCKADPFQ